MKKQDHLQERQNAIALALREVTAELRLIDPADYVSFIKMEQYSNLEDLVNSSSELSFRNGSLMFGWGADIDLSWGGKPKIFLDMEFRYESVTAFFSLGLNADGESVDIQMITFDDPDTEPSENTARLISALQMSRLTNAER